jgi:hypothetical protein
MNFLFSTGGGGRGDGLLRNITVQSDVSVPEPQRCTGLYEYITEHSSSPLLQFHHIVQRRCDHRRTGSSGMLLGFCSLKPQCYVHLCNLQQLSSHLSGNSLHLANFPSWYRNTDVSEESQSAVKLQGLNYLRIVELEQFERAQLQ